MKIKLHVPDQSLVKIRENGMQQSEDSATDSESRTVPLLPVEKQDQDKQIVAGVVLEPGTKRDGTVDDSQGSVISAEEIERAAHLWLARFQNRGLQHKRIVNSKIEIYESYVTPVNMTISGRKIKKGTWMLMYHVLDRALWKDIRKGKITGFSMGGFAKKKPVPAK